MENSKPWFRAFSLSGVVLLIGLTALSLIAIRLLARKKTIIRKEVFIEVQKGILEEERLN
jgi:hypothetical protein